MVATLTANSPLAVLLLPGQAVNTADRLRTHGWRVLLAESTCQLRRLTMRTEADVVILHAEGEEESGWLTCAKLQRLPRRPKILLVDPDEDDNRDRFASYVGATRVSSAHPKAIVRGALKLGPVGV